MLAPARIMLDTSKPDIPVDVLKNKTIVIFGFGSQGHAQAQNLADLGLTVSVALRDTSPSLTRAQSAKLNVVSDFIAAAKTADIAVLALPDEYQKDLYEQCLRDHFPKNALLIFLSGFAVHFDFVTPRPDLDVGLVAPKVPGATLRDQFVKKHDVPALISIHQDFTGKARELVTAYAKAIGCDAATLTEVTFKDEVETNLFSEQAITCGGLPALICAGYEVLISAGYPADLAYAECVKNTKRIVDLLEQHGIEGMYERISRIAAYGGLTRGPQVIDHQTKTRLKTILTDIQNKKFANEWINECSRGQINLDTLEQQLIHGTNPTKKN